MRGVVALTALVIVGLLMKGDTLPTTVTSPDSEQSDEPTVSASARADALARAQVWRTPAIAIARADLRPNVTRVMNCRFTLGDLGGTTSKFRCVHQSGANVRVKYGFGSEIPAEAAATRLLDALGFGADRVTLVERLRCYGCPREPFVTTKLVKKTGTESAYERFANPEKYQEFEWVAVEGKSEGRAIETDEQEGWAFFELDRVDASKGGAPRAHIDALRLMAVFLAHWDNKSENQRLVCLSHAWEAGNRCREPFLLLQDVGATFGPWKVDLEAWEKAHIWEDRATCAISMRALPYNGGTFLPTRISERGRRFLAGLLEQLSDAQISDLFSGARFDEPRIPFTHAPPVSEWVRVFKGRVNAISEGPPCPVA